VSNSIQSTGKVEGSRRRNRFYFESNRGSVHHSLVVEPQQFEFGTELHIHKKHCSHSIHPSQRPHNQLSIEEQRARKIGFRSTRKDRRYDQEQSLDESRDGEFGSQEQDWLSYKIRSIHSSPPSRGVDSLFHKPECCKTCIQHHNSDNLNNSRVMFFFALADHHHTWRNNQTRHPI